MLPKLKIALTATMLSSVAVVPVTVVGFVASADMAYAKSDKAGGKGNGNSGNRGNSAGGKSAKSDAKGKGHFKGKGNSGKDIASRGNGKNGAKGNGNRGFKGFRDDLEQAGNDARGLFRKLTGQKSAKAGGGGKKRTTVTETAAAIDGDMRPAVRGRPNKGHLHPSNLGNMNGSLNANENAIAAHLRNGNTNGPVGLMAVYVAGRAVTMEAIEDLGLEAEPYIELNDLLVENGYVDDDGAPDLDAYLDADEMNDDIDDALEDFSRSEQDKLLIENGFVDEDGEPDLAAYEESEEEIEGFEDASTEPGMFEDEIYADVNDANDDLAAEKDAQDALVDYWNKGDTAPEGTEDKLRDALEDRAIEVEETIVVNDALPLPSMEDDPDGEDGDDMVDDDCDGDDGCEPVDDDVAVLATE